MNLVGMARRPPVWIGVIISLAAAISIVWIGVIIGLAAAIAILFVYGSGPGTSAKAMSGPLLSECDGALRQLVIHYTADAADVVIPTYRGFFRQLPAGVTVHVVCPDTQTYDDLVARVGPTECTLSPVVVNHPITSWSRDRWLALGPSRDHKTTLLCPRGEDAAKVWPARRGTSA